MAKFADVYLLISTETVQHTPPKLIYRLNYLSNMLERKKEREEAVCIGFKYSEVVGDGGCMSR